MNGEAKGCGERRVLVTETKRKDKSLCVCVWGGSQRKQCSCVCMLHLVACQKSAAADRNAVKLKAIVSALPFAPVPLASESYYS